MDDTAPGVAGSLPRLPSYLTRFIGREHELNVLVERLADPSVRWLTLAGPGGVGKTRLAIEAVRQADARDPDAPLRGIFVPLFGISDPRVALHTIARRLDPAANDTDPLITIRTVARGERLVVLLDNVDALTPASRDLADLLLMPGCERLTISCTSRIPFNHIGEHLLTVQPLPLPDGEPTTREEFLVSPAVSLFVDRARAARIDLDLSEGDLAAIVTICRRMDGLPLAIELTASKLRQLSLPAVANRVKRSPLSLDNAIAPHSLPGHVALRASIASSFDLLEPDECAFLLRLSVFTGGISLESGRRMAAGFDPTRGYPFADGYDMFPFGVEHHGFAGADDAPALRTRDVALPKLDIDAEATLEMLAERSLLQRSFEADGTLRFEFLETINEYARERLAASGKLEAANNARAAIMIVLAEVACEGFWTARSNHVPLHRLDAELTNLRQSLEWLTDLGSDAVDLSIRLGDVLLVFFQMRGLLPEWLERIERVLAIEGSRPIQRSSLLGQVGFAYWMVGENERAEAKLHECLALVNGAGMSSYEARAHFYLALVNWRRGPEFAMHALGHLQEALRLFVDWNDEIGLGVSKLALGEVVRTSGDSATAVHLFEESVEYFERSGYAWGLATARWFLGEAARAEGDERRAADFLARGLTGYQQLGDRLGMAGCLAGVAALLAARQEWARAARLFGSASMLRENTHSFLPPTHESDHEAIATMVVQTIGPEEFQAGREGDHSVTIAEGLRVARALALGRTIDTVPFLNQKKLSRARTEVLLQLAEGKDVKEIASALGRQVSTIYRHIDGLMDDLNCTTREELRQKARLIARPTTED